MQKVQTGEIDFVFLSTANASTAQPESGVFSIHFIFRDENHAIKVLGDPKVIAAMHDMHNLRAVGRKRIVLGHGCLHAHLYTLEVPDILYRLLAVHVAQALRTQAQHVGARNLGRIQIDYPSPSTRLTTPRFSSATRLGRA
jgi:hypothetical protein